MLKIFRKNPPTLAELEEKIKTVNAEMDKMSITASAREWQKITNRLQELHKQADEARRAM